MMLNRMYNKSLTMLQCYTQHIVYDLRLHSLFGVWSCVVNLFYISDKIDTAFHLVNIDKSGEVKLKLLDKYEDVILTDSTSANSGSGGKNCVITSEHMVKVSVFDRLAM